MALNVHNQLAQLNAARLLVLGDADLYPQIVKGILPIIGANAHLDLRRWGADFLAETFASPHLGLQEKEKLCVGILQTIREWLDLPNEDYSVIKNAIQTAASVYGLIFRYIISNPLDSLTWERMAAIKSNITRRWDSSPGGIRVCCIKFVQRVVQVQTPGVIADPRRSEQNEVSLALVPREHPLIPPSRLEPEALGLLDRLLNVFHEETRCVSSIVDMSDIPPKRVPSDAILINATLNCLGILIRTRANAANRIINAILNFNPLKMASPSTTSKTKVHIKSMERTTRTVLMNVLRRNENGPFAGRIRQYLERLAQTRFELLDEGSRKRGLPSEPTDGLDNAKRMRLGAEISDRPPPPPLPPGPVSHAQLFTLTGDRGLSSFDVTQLPVDLVARITLPILHHIDQSTLDAAIGDVRSRLHALKKRQAAENQNQVQAHGEDEEDYEPDFGPTQEQVLNQANNLPPEDPLAEPPDLALGPFKLPQPPPLTLEETEKVGKGTIERVFSIISTIDEPAAVKRQKPGLNRVAGSNYDKDAWMTLFTRLATRASAGLDEDEDDIPGDDGDELNGIVTKRSIPPSLSNGIREMLWKSIITDFRTKMPIAISWLSEEWLNDQLQFQDQRDRKRQRQGNYEHWMLKVFDGILPFLDAKDNKVLTRFLSEIPSLDEKVIDRVKGLARDPERIVLSINALGYLATLRPPIREICIDALEDMWRNYDDAKIPASRFLKKLRPEILKESSTPDNPPAPPPPPDKIKSPPPSENKENLPSASATGEGVQAASSTVAAVG
ncbi:MAG: hypothetical protein Q9174_001676 [Haloplaca sp. 1 TL-2023]